MNGIWPWKASDLGIADVLDSDAVTHAQFLCYVSVDTAPYRYEEPKEDSTDAEGCAAQKTRKKCLAMDGCTFNAKEKECTEESDKVSCTAITRSRECKANDLCLWLGGKKGQCYDSGNACSAITKPKTCKNTAGCRYAKKKNKCLQ